MRLSCDALAVRPATAIDEHNSRAEKPAVSVGGEQGCFWEPTPGKQTVRNRPYPVIEILESALRDVRVSVHDRSNP